ncbi:cartilage acidic protein 1 [Patella vulgata]|uniref:cartilage acidic protein 1 n=1 Tax=Patella vulgata TaxID=6465 RepID=UPI0024A9EB1E|nr:cartilage acidic protein 1 [Patella vulgata]
MSRAGRGVCACDIDGNGREEIYILNTNHHYSGPKTYRDKLFIWRNGKYVDLFSDVVNAGLPMFAGRSVACLDRNGDGKYGFVLTTYADGGRGAFRLIEMNIADHKNNISTGDIVLIDSAVEAGINYTTGGQGIAVGSIFGIRGLSDIFITAEGRTIFSNIGNNNLFQNTGNGKFTSIAPLEVADKNQDGRGVSLCDLNNDGFIDVVYGNWLGPHRMFLQQRNSNGDVRFQNVATKDFARTSPISSVITADFNNDGYIDIFHGNMFYVLDNIEHKYVVTNNRLFTSKSTNNVLSLENVDIGDAEESTRSTTGASIADLDGDGYLELIICHNDLNSPTLSLYEAKKVAGNHWYRIMPLTKYGAPARGATVTLTLDGSITLKRVVDSGSGYMSQMEPVAHFGLGKRLPKSVSIVWTDGRYIRRSVSENDIDTFYIITYNGIMEAQRKEWILAEPEKLNDSTTIHVIRHVSSIVSILFLFLMT